MLRKGFRLLSRSIRSKSDKKELEGLRCTLKYLANNHMTLSSLFHLSEKNCEEDVVSLLNRSLPDIVHQQKTVQTHYDILMHNLKEIADRDLCSKPLRERLDSCKHDSNALYRLLWERCLYHKEGLSPRDMCRIVMNSYFSAEHANELVSSLKTMVGCKADFAVILCYKTWKEKLYNEWHDNWVTNYFKLTGIGQKLFWRVEMTMGGIGAVKESVLKTELQNNGSHVVMLHQVLFQSSYRLPEALLQAPLTHNQLLFCKIVRLLSRWSKTYSQAHRWCSSLVKTSIKNKLSHDSTASDLDFECESTTKRNVNIFQFYNLQAMNKLLCEVSRHSTHLAGFHEELMELLQQLRQESEKIELDTELRFPTTI